MCWQVVGAQQLCGNALVEGLEQCDDGNTSPGDGCSPTCQVGRLLRLQTPCCPFSCFLLSRAPSHGRLLNVPFSCSHLMLPSHQTARLVPLICSQAKQHVALSVLGDAALQCTCEPCMDPNYCFTFNSWPEQCTLGLCSVDVCNNVSMAVRTRAISIQHPALVCGS